MQVTKLLELFWHKDVTIKRELWPRQQNFDENRTQVLRYKERIASSGFLCEYFRHYLYGSDFIVRTDHSSVRWLMNFQNQEGRVARWLEILYTYTFTVEHRPGRLHGNADSLRRKPDSQSNKAVEDEDACIVGSTDRNCLQLHITEAEDDDRNLIKLQREDEDLARVRTWVENKERPCSKDNAASSFMMKSLWNQFPRLDTEWFISQEAGKL